MKCEWLHGEDETDSYNLFVIACLKSYDINPDKMATEGKYRRLNSLTGKKNRIETKYSI